MTPDTKTPTVFIVATDRGRSRLREWLPQWGFTPRLPPAQSNGGDIWRQAGEVRVVLTDAIPPPGAAPAFRLAVVERVEEEGSQRTPEGADDVLPIPLDPMVTRARILLACRVVRLEAELASARQAPATLAADRRAELKRRRMAARIARAKAEWEATVDAVSAPIALLDHRDVVIRCNRALGKLAGRELRRCPGLRWEDLFPGLPLPMPEGLPLEWTHRPSGRTFFLSNRSVETPGGGRDPGKVVAMMDISERRRAEVEVMARVDRWATLGALAMTTAHEINNPLAGLRLQANNLETLLPPCLEDPCAPASGARPDRESLRRQVSECLSGILSASERIGAIVEELRRFGRPRDAPSRPVDVRQVVDSALALLGPRLKDIRVTTSLAPDLGPIPTNPIKLEQVLINLIANAADALAEDDGLERRELSISAVGGGDGIVLEVADTAGGIPPGVAERIFKTYVSTKPVERGTGLGLMITRANVHALGGEITFTTQPDRGTTFTVRLPGAQAPAQEDDHDRTDSHR